MVCCSDVFHYFPTLNENAMRPLKLYSIKHTPFTHFAQKTPTFTLSTNYQNYYYLKNFSHSLYSSTSANAHTTSLPPRQIQRRRENGPRKTPHLRRLELARRRVVLEEPPEKALGEHRRHRVGPRDLLERPIRPDPNDRVIGPALSVLQDDQIMPRRTPVEPRERSRPARVIRVPTQQHARQDLPNESRVIERRTWNITRDVRYGRDLRILGALGPALHPPGTVARQLGLSFLKRFVVLLRLFETLLGLQMCALRALALLRDKLRLSSPRHVRRRLLHFHVEREALFIERVLGSVSECSVVAIDRLVTGFVFGARVPLRIRVFHSRICAFHSPRL